MIRKRLFDVFIPLITFLTLFALWEFLARATGTPKWILPKPSDIIRSMIVNFSDFWPHILVTLQTALFGFIIAVPIGIAIATAISSSKFVSNALAPYITVLVVTPLLALVPLLMLIFGYGMRMRIIAVVIQTFGIVNMNSCTGFLNVPVMRRELMQSIGASRTQTFFKMMVPSAATDIFSGVRLAGIFCTTACISTEYVGGNMGLGSQIIKYSQFLKTTESFACIFFVAIVGIIMFSLISFIQKKTIFWKI